MARLVHFGPAVLGSPKRARCRPSSPATAGPDGPTVLEGRHVTERRRGARVVVEDCPVRVVTSPRRHEGPEPGMPLADLGLEDLVAATSHSFCHPRDAQFDGDQNHVEVHEVARGHAVRHELDLAGMAEHRHSVKKETCCSSSRARSSAASLDAS